MSSAALVFVTSLVPVFKTIPVADAIYRAETLPDGARSFARDTLALGWEERLKTRGRRVSDRGVEFGTALPRGSVLRAGDCLVITPARAVIEVIERLEPAFVIEPRTPVEWGLFAYHLGNGHQPLMITDEALVCPDLPGVEMLLRYNQIPFRRADVAFTPTTGYGHVAI
jgi:urease accessory protein UreE